jgi:hypothetical protein
MTRKRENTDIKKSNENKTNNDKAEEINKASYLNIDYFDSSDEEVWWIFFGPGRII